MSYSITLINSGNSYITSNNSFFKNYEVFDIDGNVLNNTVILDDETNSISFSIIIKNNLSKNQLQPSIQKFFINIAPSILFNSNIKFSGKLLLNVVINGNVYSVSSDYISSTTDAIIGIIFTNSQEFTQGYLNNQTLKNKFILIPYVIENEESASLDFTFTLIDEFSTALRRKYPRFDQILYDLSKIYISAVEQNDNVSLVSLYNNLNSSNYLLLERLVLNQSNTSVDIDNYLFFTLNLNGTRYTYDSNALDSFVLNTNYNFLCDLLINSSSNGFIHSLVNAVNSSNAFQFSTIPENFPIDFIGYVEKVLKLVIIDILRPYYINIPYLPIHQLNNSKKISKTLNTLLQNLYDGTASKKLLPGYVFSTSTSDILDDLTRRKLYNLVFIYSNFYIQFLLQSVNKGALSSISFSEINDLISFLNDTGHLNFYNENINKINVISKDELQNTDIYFLFTLLPVLIVYSHSGKNIFNSEVGLITNINDHYALYREITEKLGLIDLGIDIDVDPIAVPTNLNKNFLLKETVLLGILDQLSTLNLPIFDSNKFASLHIRDHYANYVNILYNIFANISEEIILVNNMAPNNYNYTQSLLDLNVKLVNALIFVQNLNRKFQQNSVNVKFIFNDTLF